MRMGSAPSLTRPQLSRVLRTLLPQRVWAASDLLAWIHRTQARNEQAKRSHLKRHLRLQHEQHAAPRAA